MVRAWCVVAVVAVALAGPRLVHADAKTQALAIDYEKEANACDVRAAGMNKVVSSTVELAKASNPNDTVIGDMVNLEAARDVVVGYCDALADMLELLRTDPSASYRSLEKRIDDGDNKIRALRKANQHAIDAAAPILARLIPRINARRAAGEPDPTRMPRAFPSGRTVQLPLLPGRWKTSGDQDDDVLQYRQAGARLALDVRASRAVSCDQQAALVAKRAVTVDMQRDAPGAKATHEAWVLMWPTGAVWKASYTAGGRFVQVVCVPAPNGSALVTLDQPDAGRIAQDINDIAAAMTGQVVVAMAQTGASP